MRIPWPLIVLAGVGLTLILPWLGAVLMPDAPLLGWFLAGLVAIGTLGVVVRRL